MTWSLSFHLDEPGLFRVLPTYIHISMLYIPSTVHVYVCTWSEWRSSVCKREERRQKKERGLFDYKRSLQFYTSKGWMERREGRQGRGRFFASFLSFFLSFYSHSFFLSLSLTQAGGREAGRRQHSCCMHIVKGGKRRRRAALSVGQCWVFEIQKGRRLKAKKSSVQKESRQKEEPDFHIQRGTAFIAFSPLAAGWLALPSAAADKKEPPSRCGRLPTRPTHFFSPYQEWKDGKPGIRYAGRRRHARYILGLLGLTCVSEWVSGEKKLLLRSFVRVRLFMHE